MTSEAARDRQVARETVRHPKDCPHCNPGAQAPAEVPRCAMCKGTTVWLIRHRVKTDERYHSGEFKYKVIDAYACKDHLGDMLGNIGKSIPITVRGIE